MKLCIAIAVMLLAGCATRAETVWMKAGATEEDYLTDKGQCRAQAASVAGVTLLQLAIVERNCMFGKGWRQAPKG